MDIKNKMLFETNPVEIMLEEARVRKEEEDKIVIEFLVDTEFYKLFKEEESVLQESMSKTVNLKKGNIKVTIVIRDKETATMGGKCSHIESPSIRVVGPVNKLNCGKGQGQAIDIIIPQFKKNGERNNTNEKFPGEVNGEAIVDKKNRDYGKKKPKDYPPELKLAIEFAKDFAKRLSLIYKHPENTRNQIELFKEIIRDCDYIDELETSDTDNEERINRKVKKVSENAYGRIDRFIDE